MIKKQFKILPTGLFRAYCEQVTEAFLLRMQQLQESELTIDSFSFYTSVSAVFSSRIEGEEIELDSYIKHKRFGIPFLPDYTQKTDDLYNAYLFSQKTKLNSVNVSAAHRILSGHLLPTSRQGALRAGNMYVTTPEGRIEYVAAVPAIVHQELEKFYTDVELLLNSDLTTQEIFFYASLLHLVIVKIHPFEDGNGRTARLIEKWFLAEKLGEKAWLLQSEKTYYQLHDAYNHSIRLLGLEYQELDYTKALPFLLILPKALETGESGT